mgnify:CR=1 FL=1
MTSELDLHGVKHPDVDMIVENYVLMNKTPMNIITGRSDKMIGLATDVLKKHRFQYYIRCHNAGMITIIKKTFA